ETLWMTDFDRAVECGMGFKVDLIETQWRAGFDRLLAIGVRLSADEIESKRLIESLIDNHYYGGARFNLLPPGSPAHHTHRRGPPTPAAATPRTLARAGPKTWTPASTTSSKIDLGLKSPTTSSENATDSGWRNTWALTPPCWGK